MIKNNETKTTVPDWFDSEFYLAKNPDVAAQKVDPWLHCYQIGWREFRNPSATFDLWCYSIWYLDADPERNPLDHYHSFGHANQLQTCLIAGLRIDLSVKSHFNSQSLALFRKLTLSADTWARVARNLAYMAIWDVADMVAVRACSLAPEVAEHQRLLAHILAKRKIWRRAANALQTAVGLKNNDADWFHDLGFAYEQLNWFEKAAIAYQRALSLNSQRRETLYRYGRVCEALGLLPQATELWYRLSLLDSEVAEFGIGIAHQQQQDWIAAELAYRNRLSEAQHANHAGLHFAHGFALEMLFRWEEAVVAYTHALSLDKNQPHWHYRAGVVFERLERFTDAANQYQHALSLRTDPDWHYRHATCLWRMGEFSAAIAGWLQSLSGQMLTLPFVDNRLLQTRQQTLLAILSTSQLNADIHFELGTIYERLGLYHCAVDAYRQAIARRNDYSASDYYRLGVVLFQRDELEQSCEAFSEVRLIKRDFKHVPLDVLDRPLDLKTQYAEFLDTLPVNPCIVLYECFAGNNIGCNPLAIFNQARTQFAGVGWQHIWVVKPETVIPNELACLADVYFVRHGSKLYLRYLATAGWLVNNDVFMPYFLRRPEQRYLISWHDMSHSPQCCEPSRELFSHKNLARNLLQVTHLAVVDQDTADMLLTSCQISEVFTASVAKTGHPREDTLATQRVVSFFFENDTAVPAKTQQKKKRSLLFYPGPFDPNGITASFIQLMSALDTDKLSLSLVAEPWMLESYPQRLLRYQEVPDYVQRWGRISYPVVNAEEQWLMFRQISTTEVLDERVLVLLNRAYQREYRRQFGWAHIDVVIDFTGYSPFWSALLTRGRPKGVRAITYMHNDMRQEQAVKYPLLSKVFEQYPFNDALVSVSADLNRLHISQFSSSTTIPASHFLTAENIINPERIRQRAESVLPDSIETWRQGCLLIGAAGRLSPEKGHLRLIDAFHLLRQQYPAIKLVIAGEGPEREIIVQQIERMGLRDSVRLTGNLYNPYPLIRALDLFVLPSFHEGQGIVLLEALTLGVPVISTNIPGPSNILGKGEGLLVENSVEGLLQGMLHWLQVRPPTPKWDANAYRQRALDQFYSLI